MTFRKAIVSAGPTREWIDPVRFISNASSGKMGFCIAGELAKRIPEVVYVCGNVTERYATFKKGKTIRVETTMEMKKSVLSELEDSTLVIMAAAPADFRPAKKEKNKIKKKSGELALTLEENPDILLACKKKIDSKKFKNSKTVGFAAETEKLEEHASEKLKKKGLSFIIGNYVDSNRKGFGERETSVQIYSQAGLEASYGPDKKEKVAKFICNFLLRNL